MCFLGDVRVQDKTPVWWQRHKTPKHIDNYIHHRASKHFVNQDLHMAWNKTQGTIREGAREN